MFKNLLFISLILFLGLPSQVISQCVDCNVMICDGGLCDDGSSADGVQTSRNCGCGKEISGACAMVQVDLSTSPYYNPEDSSCGLLLSTQESGNFWIYFIEEGCMPADCLNPDVIASNGDKFEMPDSPLFTAMVCKDGGNAGRRDFNLTVSCTSVENCQNLIDDDFNGFVDCDDPGCVEYCNFSSTTSSGDGGLESNNRLAEKIALRKYFRTIDSYNSKALLTEHNKLGFFETPKVVFRNLPSISELTPWDAIPNSEVYNTTPIDIIEITNAEDIFAFDVIQNDARVASVLATETTENVYEHSKYICDRLSGSTIENIWETNLGTDFSFIVTKFSNKDGNEEYNLNFSLIQNQNNAFELHSHWNLYDYPEGAKIYNFQLWANNTHNLQQMAQRFLKIIKYKIGISNSFSTGLPTTYVASVEYLEKNILMKIKNLSKLKKIIFKGQSRSTEMSIPEEFEMEVPLSGKEQENVVIPTDGIYDISFSLNGYNVESVPDVIYLADGSWGLDYIPSSVKIERFEISDSGDISEFDKEYKLERNIRLSGTKKGTANIFRTLNAHNRPKNLTNYNSLKFSAKGRGNFEVILVHKDISNWEEHPRTSIYLNNYRHDYNLYLQDFYSPEPVDWDGISMIIFSQKYSAGEDNSLEVSISDLRFSNSKNIERMESSTRLNIAPNPLTDSGFIAFELSHSGPYNFQLLSLEGKVLEEHRGHAIKGKNTIPITSNDYLPGIYLVKIRQLNKELMMGKLIILHD